MTASIEHPCLIAGTVEARGHQLDALRKCLAQPTLVVLPTGQGKTAIAWMAIAQTLHEGGKAIMVAPTNPLIEQHFQDLKEVLSIDESEIIKVSGNKTWQKREVMMQDARVVVATPQVIRNDAQRGSLSLDDYALIVFDEAHHATGNQAMAQVGDLFLDSTGPTRILACTASPGWRIQVIEEVIKRLGIERIHNLRSNDPLLLPYVQGLEITEIRIEVPEETRALAKPLEELLLQYLERLSRLGFIPVKGLVGMRILMDSQNRISLAIKRGNPQAYNAAKINADAIRLHNLLSLLLSQGPLTAMKSLARMEDESKKGSRTQARLVANPLIRTLISQLHTLQLPNPKLKEVKELVSQSFKTNPQARLIVFTNYRDTMEVIHDGLLEIENSRPTKFFGQAKKKGSGMSQKEQLARLQSFRDGEFNVLIATSVGEEGLDVPSADLVIFHEPVASEIRTIQRRGRTARHREGRVVVLVAEGTRDEGVRHSAQAREEKMHKSLARAARSLRGNHVLETLEERLQHFSVKVGEGGLKAATWMMNEVERLAPQLKEMEEIEAPANQITTAAKQMKIDVKPQQLRPRAQTSIDSFLPPPTEQTPTTSLEGDWSQPILDGNRGED
jgi:ERCC4-related helicase